MSVADTGFQINIGENFDFIIIVKQVPGHETNKTLRLEEAFILLPMYLLSTEGE